MSHAIAHMARAARQAALELSAAPSALKDAALIAIADALWNAKDAIAAANAEDIRQSREESLADPLLKRLLLDEKKLRDTLDGVTQLSHMPDPVGTTQLSTELAEGLELYRVSCPIGVIGIIFESRPDALVQIAMLCLKSGNAVLLKGGREAARTNRILFDTMILAGRACGLPEGWAGLLESREDVAAMLKQDEDIDLIIPRGSYEFVRYIMDNSRIPVLGHAEGMCHVYVDRAADPDMAVRVSVDAKAQYCAVCNAAETLLVHKEAAPRVLPMIKAAMDEAHVTLRGCARTQAIISVEPAVEEDWDTEYLDYILSVKVVDTLDEAIEHINTHGSGHTDTIITEDRDAAKAFLLRVDSSGVFHNCSTRFADGYRYGFGAEVGIATSKIHARGPMGLEGLLIYKYKLLGHGDIVADFAQGKRQFTHRKLTQNCPL